MIPYLGNFAEDDVVYLMFNTFTSDDPSASCTITNFVNTDVHIHKDDGLTQRNNAAGITVSTNFDGITGSHLIKIDTNDNTVAGFWIAGHDYFVRIEGTTVDAATINATVAHFSIENRYTRGTDSAALATTALSNAVWTNAKAGQIDAAITSRNATTPPTVIAIRTEMDANSTKMAPSQTLADYKATGFNTTTPPTVGEIRTEMEGIGSKLETIEGYTDKIDDATNGLTAIKAEVEGLAGEAMRGTNGANTTTPPTVGEIADQVWDEILTGATHNIATSAGRRVREIGSFAILGDTATAGTSVSITLNGGASATDGIYNRNLIAIVAGTGAGQTRQIADYVGSTKVVTVDREWRVIPDNTSEFVITASNVFALVDQGQAQAGTANTITLRSYASAINDTYLCNQVVIIAGAGRGQSRLIGAYNGTTKVATICGENWVTTPDTTSTYVLLPYGTTCTSCIGDHGLGQINGEVDTALADYGANTTTPPTVTEIRTEMEGAGSKILAIEGDTNELQTNQGDWATATSVEVSDKTGFSLSSAGVTAIWDEVVEGTHTMKKYMRLFASMLVGKVSGGGSETITFRDSDDSKNRIVMTVTEVGDRTAVVVEED